MPSLAFPCFLKSNYSKIDFLGLFSQVRNNKLMHLWLGISPPSRCKDKKRNWNGKIIQKEIAINIRIFVIFAFGYEWLQRRTGKIIIIRRGELHQTVKAIASLRDFRPLSGEDGIYSVWGEQCGDFNNLLYAARKAVCHGYRVFILPNPKGVRSADFIFEQKGIFKLFDLKTIYGTASIGNRLKESIGQTNRVLLNIRCDYEGRLLAFEIKKYFCNNSVPEHRENTSAARWKNIGWRWEIISATVRNNMSDRGK